MPGEISGVGGIWLCVWWGKKSGDGGRVILKVFFNICIVQDMGVGDLGEREGERENLSSPSLWAQCQNLNLGIRGCCGWKH